MAAAAFNSQNLIIITREYTRILDGYKNDYFENEEATIPDEYINSALNNAIQGTITDEDFLAAMDETPLTEWDNEDFREFIFEHCAIQTDYPM